MRLILLLSLAVASQVSAQSPGEPPCALPCLSSAIQAAGCGASDVPCFCGTARPAIQTAITPCLLSSCSQPDVLKAASAGLALCSSYEASVAASPIQPPVQSTSPPMVVAAMSPMSSKAGIATTTARRGTSPTTTSSQAVLPTASGIAAGESKSQSGGVMASSAPGNATGMDPLQASGVRRSVVASLVGLVVLFMGILVAL